MNNFDSSYFFDATDLFEGIPPPPPTASPTYPPPTSSPTDAPSVITVAPTTASPSVASTADRQSDQPSRITDQPSISPSKSQTISTYDANCEDEPGYKFKGKSECSWAFKNLNRVRTCSFDLFWTKETGHLFFHFHFPLIRLSCNKCDSVDNKTMMGHTCSNIAEQLVASASVKMMPSCIRVILSGTVLG